MEFVYLGLAQLVVALIVWAIFIVRYRKDPRRLSNAVILFPLVIFSIMTIAEFLTALFPEFGILVGIGMALTPLVLVIFGFALVYNGVVMWRREGARLSNLLSLVAGILIFVLPVIAVALLVVNTWWSYALAFMLFMASVFTACLFVMLLLYAWVHAKFPATGSGAAVVVLGARTIKGKVTPLLRGRLDKGIDLYQLQETPKMLMVPSGGQGADELEPEGVSMGRYLSEQGVSSQDLLIEDRAADTDQNLTFSNTLVREQRPEGQLWIVTSDYHALRAALASRRLGLDARAFGGKTAAYYRPSAFLRECVAIVRDQLKLVMLLALPFAAILAGALLLITNPALWQ